MSLKLDLDLEGKSGASIQVSALFDPEREEGLLLAKVGLPRVSLSERVLQGSRGIEGPRPRSRIESGIKGGEEKKASDRFFAIPRDQLVIYRRLKAKLSILKKKKNTVPKFPIFCGSGLFCHHAWKTTTKKEDEARTRAD